MRRQRFHLLGEVSEGNCLLERFGVEVDLPQIVTFFGSEGWS